MDGRCEDFSYQVIYKKVRHMTIRVTAAAQVIVTAPYGYPKETVRGFVEAKSGWIRKHLAVRADAGKADNRAVGAFFRGRRGKTAESACGCLLSGVCGLPDTGA